MPSFDGKDYKVLVGSDVQRDGMYLEVTEREGQNGAEIFYSDANGSMVLTTWGNALPLSLVEWMIGEAKNRLPQSSSPTTE